MLREKIRRGADLRVFASFRQNEHIEVGSANCDIIREVPDLPCTCLPDKRPDPIRLRGSIL